MEVVGPTGHIGHIGHVGTCRQNQDLEQSSAVLHEEQRKLQREAASLANRLEAVLQDKFIARSGFDADTPIDKTLQFLQEVIAVGCAWLCVCACCVVQ